MRGIVATVIAGLMLAPAVLASDHNQTETIQDAQKVLTASVNAPDKGIPKDLLQKAECIGVFPGVKKGAFIVGGEFGRGVFTCRQSDGSMSAPAFFSIGGPSIGWQWGGSSTDLVLLIMNESGLEHLLQDKFTIGGEASAVAGPVGRSATAATDAQLHAQILSWSRAKGAFLGAALEGIVVKPDQKATTEFYGKPLTAKDLLVHGESVTVPSEAKAFVKTTTEYAKRS